MASEYKHYRKIEFSDTDLAGIVHFSRFFIYMESAEHAFFRSLGYSIHTMIGEKNYGWPRIAAECKYKYPLRFEEEIEIHLRIEDIQEKTIRYHFSFHRIAPEPRVLAAEGWLTVVCVTEDQSERRFRSVSIPEEIRNRLEIFTKEKV